VINAPQFIRVDVRVVGDRGVQRSATRGSTNRTGNRRGGTEHLSISLIGFAVQRMGDVFEIRMQNRMSLPWCSRQKRIQRVSIPFF
jgi:hypothetical protein